MNGELEGMWKEAVVT